jgi:hypothetical protein
MNAAKLTFSQMPTLFCLNWPINHPHRPYDGAAEVVLAAAIHSLLLTNGRFCRGALTDGA